MVKITHLAPLPHGYLEAGKEFDEALSELGLSAAFVTWAFDRDINSHVLVIITDFLDYAGPYEISKQIFKAYNASALPKSIDPFVIRFFSDKEWIGRAMLKVTSPELNEEGGAVSENGDYWITQGLECLYEWIVNKRAKRRRGALEVQKRWKAFQSNVMLVAA
ncbi:hypothetical protein [Ensifer soli]|uniref:hypothetical protein n=1 Tax=Ciceribacter sp. sgz301302 TaxID=3342379 RepID=UPI0035B92DFE